MVVCLCCRRQHTRNRHRNMRLCRPRDNWPIFSRTGLYLCPCIKEAAKGLDFAVSFLFVSRISKEKIVDEFSLNLSK